MGEQPSGAKAGAKSAPTSPLPHPNPGDVWYFAFGSNLNPTVLTGRRRVFPRASVPVKLDGWALGFNMRGVPYLEPGMATLVRLAPDAPRPPMPAKPIVTGAQAHQARLAAGLHGVAHLISASEWDMVKLTEGVKLKGLGYQVVPVTCDTYDGQKVEALTLVAAPASTGDPAGILPSPRYLTLIREGARLHGLDPAYCDMLEAHPVYPNQGWNAKLGQYAMLGVTVAISLPLVPVALGSALASAAYSSLTGWGRPQASSPSPSQPVPTPGALASNPITATPANQQPPAPAPAPDAPSANSSNHGDAASAVSAAASLKVTETKAPPGGLALMWLRQNTPSSMGPYFMYTLGKGMQLSHELLLKWVLGNGYTVTSDTTTAGQAQPQLAPADDVAGNGKQKSS